MDDYTDSLGEAMLFATLDANSGYWQIEMGKKDVGKTAYVAHNGLYKLQQNSLCIKERFSNVSTS